MARLVKEIQIGYGGEPSIYTVQIGKRDIPLLEARTSAMEGQTLQIVSVKFMVAPRRSATYPYEVGSKDFITSIQSVEKSILFDKKGKVLSKPVNRSVKTINERYQLPKGSRIKDVETILIDACEKAIEKYNAKKKTTRSKAAPTKTTRPRKVIKEWVNGKLKIKTEIKNVVWLTHSPGYMLRLAFIDSEGSSVTAMISSKSNSYKKLEPFLKNKREVETIPRDQKTYTYDFKPLVGLWLSTSDAYESPLSESEIGSRKSTYLGGVTKYTMTNPRIIGK